MKVLFADDDTGLRLLLGEVLTRLGHEVEAVADGAAAWAAWQRTQPPLVLLDWQMPGLDGVEVARRIRGWSATPIIVLSARGREQDKIEALDAGADDYLTKPFGVGELLARMRVALRNAARVAASAGHTTFTVRDLRVDLEARRVFVREQEVHLTRTQFNLLAALVRRAGRVVTHRQLLREVWGPGATEPHYVRVYMGHLRRKLEADAAQPRYLVTEIGVGYRLLTE